MLGGLGHPERGATSRKEIVPRSVHAKLVGKGASKDLWIERGRKGNRGCGGRVKAR